MGCAWGVHGVCMGCAWGGHGVGMWACFVKLLTSRCGCSAILLVGAASMLESVGVHALRL